MPNQLLGRRRLFLIVIALAASCWDLGAIDLAAVEPKAPLRCDGSTDITADLQRALEDAAAEQQEVSLPKGKCMIDHLTWPLGLKAVLGTGMESTILERLPTSTANVVLSIVGAGPFHLQDLTISGNSANNHHPNHDIVLADDWGYTIERVKVTGAVAAGTTYGYGIYQLRDTNLDHRTRSIIRECVGTQNGNSGVGGESASNLLIEGGHWIRNGDSGINWYKPWQPGAMYVSGVTIRKVDGSGNRGYGIRLAYWGFGEQDEKPSGTSKDITIEDNVLRENLRGGIAFQGAGGIVLDNLVQGNGGPALGDSAILYNAIGSQLIGNRVLGNRTFFGIDAGGSFNSRILENVVTDNGTTDQGTGLNIGGSSGDDVSDNRIANNGHVQVYFARQEAGERYFPWDSGPIRIENNIIRASRTKQSALEIVGAPSGLLVQSNHLYALDSQAALTDSSTESSVSGNRVNEQMKWISEASPTIVVPDWASNLEIHGSTPVKEIYTHTSWVNRNSVVAVYMTSRGQHYTSPPSVLVEGGGCTEVRAEAELTADGRVAQIVIKNQGANCTTTPTVSLAGGGGVGAAAVVPRIGAPRGERICIEATAAPGVLARLKIDQADQSPSDKALEERRLCPRNGTLRVSGMSEKPRQTRSSR
jgi:hypothetical protein